VEVVVEEMVTIMEMVLMEQPTLEVAAVELKTQHVEHQELVVLV
jgi:hypothetical protein